jgi:hypothetical protein
MFREDKWYILAISEMLIRATVKRIATKSYNEK